MATRSMKFMQQQKLVFLTNSMCFLSTVSRVLKVSAHADQVKCILLIKGSILFCVCKIFGIFLNLFLAIIFRSKWGILNLCLCYECVCVCLC